MVLREGIEPSGPTPKYKDEAALYQTELSQQYLADRAGIDPATSCSTGKCSTTELTIQNQTENGLGKRTRTSRLMLPKHALYQMSHTEKIVVEMTGIEPATVCLQSRCSSN
jgi:hypothetical protein